MIFSAVLTAGDDELVGGTLLSADGSIQYGPFVTGSSKGAYSIELTWSAINQAQDITFVDDEERTFVAQFFDAEGRKATKSLAIGLTCNGKSACSGTCVDLSTDLEHCGSCGTYCPSAEGEPAACQAGACVVRHEITPLDCASVCEQFSLACAPACEFFDGARPGQAQVGWYEDFDAPAYSTDCSNVPAATSDGKPFKHEYCCCK